MALLHILPVLALLALPCSAEYTPRSQTEAEKVLLDWAVANGAKLKVTIDRRAHDNVRGLFAKEPIKAGEAVLEIPEHIILSVPNVGAAEAAPVLLRELHSNCSRFAPYLAIFPTEDEVLTGYNWPEEYIPYLGSKSLIEQVRESFQRHTKDVLAGKHDDELALTIPEAIGKVNISLPYFQRVTASLTSRTFSLRSAALSLVPVGDLFNHDVRELNKLDDVSDRNFRVIAGSDIEPGDEVTITYGTMRNDEYLLYYGFVDEVTSPPRLCAIDHPNYELYKNDSSDTLGLTPFAGTPFEIREEISRLRGLAASVEYLMQHLFPIPTTKPYLAHVLTRFQELRAEAIAAEIARLNALLVALEGGTGEDPVEEGAAAPDDQQDL